MEISRNDASGWIWTATGKDRLSDDTEEIPISTDRNKRIECYYWLRKV